MFNTFVGKKIDVKIEIPDNLIYLNLKIKCYMITEKRMSV